MQLFLDKNVLSFFRLLPSLESSNLCLYVDDLRLVTLGFYDIVNVVSTNHIRICSLLLHINPHYTTMILNV